MQLIFAGVLVKHFQPAEIYFHSAILESFFWNSIVANRIDYLFTTTLSQMFEGFVLFTSGLIVD